MKFILLVEDNRFTAELVIKILSQIPTYFVLHVEESQEVVEIIRNVLPDLLLLDYQLPSMNGIELYDQLCKKKSFKEVPTIILSSLVRHEPVYQEIVVRQLYAFPKPFEPGEFLRFIQLRLENTEKLHL